MKKKKNAEELRIRNARPPPIIENEKGFGLDNPSNPNKVDCYLNCLI